MKHKLLAILLSGLLLLEMLPTNVLAASGAILAVESVSAECVTGTEISVPVTAEQNDGYAAGTIDVNWDKTALKLKDVVYSDNAPANSPAAIAQGTYRVSFGNYQTTDNFTAIGSFFTLVFEVSESATAGDYEITLENASLYDTDLNEVPTTLEAGKVTLTDKQPEDALILEAGNTEAEIGSEKDVCIPVNAVQNPGYAAGTVDVKWDKTALKLKDVVYSDNAPANSPAAIAQGTYRVSFGNYQTTDNFTATGSFFTLVFEVSESATAGDYEITLENASLYDTDLNEIPTTLEAGKVTLNDKQPEDALILEAGNTEAEIGSEKNIRIPVNAVQNPGYAAGTVDVKWDKTALKLKDVVYSDNAPANSPASIAQGTYRVSFGNYQTTNNFTATGVFFTLVFEVSESATAGDYEIALENASLYDTDLNEVPTSLKAGVITLSSPETTTSTTTTTIGTTTTTTTNTTTTEPTQPLKGDYNNDMEITIEDAVLLARFLAEDTTLTDEQIDKILNADPDYDSDGLVTILDVTALLNKLGDA